MKRPHNMILRKIVLGVCAAALLSASSGFGSGSAAAGEGYFSFTIHQRPSYSWVDHDRYDDMPVPWHMRMHDQNHRWYHRNVADGHQYLRPSHHRDWNDDAFGRPHRAPIPFNRPSYPRDRFVVDHSRIGPPAVRHDYGNACDTVNSGTLAGAALGGLIGSQFGRGDGKIAATAAGTFLGAVIGSGAGCR